MSWLDRFRSRDTNAESAVAHQEADAAGIGSIEGERRESAVQRPPSLQSRLTNLLALGLMGALGLGLLGWYYADSWDRRAKAQVAAQSSAQDKAKGDVILRPLGRVDQPVPTKSSSDSTLENILGKAPEEPPPADIPRAWIEPAEESVYPPRTAAAGQRQRTRQEQWLERQLSGPAFSASRISAAAGDGGDIAVAQGAVTTPTAGDMDSFLRPGLTKAVSAQMLPTRRLLLPKGAFIDCTLETAIDSSLPGMTTCVMATDSFSADGSVVLLERGTKLVGETRGQVKPGSARVFVLWTEARTPTGVVIPLASPGTDELGRSGLSGAVNRHFFERFGAAILISVIDGVIQAQTQSDGNGTVIYNPTTTENIMTEVLKSTINIPPTVVKPQGDRIQVLVARDLDFRSVYELRPVASDH